MEKLQQFAIGQRWLSDTETELGLGVLIDVDERSVSILFPKSDETRVYARSNAPLSRIIFNANDELQDQEGIYWTVESVEDRHGVVRYHVVRTLEDGSEERKALNETRVGASIQLSKPLDRLLASQIDYKEWYDLRIEALLMQANMQSSPLRGLIGSRVGLIPHQLYIAHEVGQRFAPRVLLADEVGLGKTIEAGLIMHQQLKTGRSERILILVPDSLQYQWMIEMRRRFNLEFSLFDLTRTASIKEHDPDLNPFLTEQRIIASVDLMIDHEDLREQALEAGFDLLVVDEAHHLMWSEEEGGNDRYDLVEELAEHTAGVLLLTATPEQLGVESHFARLRLLDPQRFSSLDRFLDEEEQYQHTAKIAEALMSDMPLEAEHLTAIEDLLGHAIEDTAEQRFRAIHELLDRHGTGRILFRNTREAIQGFPGRDCQPVPLPAPENWSKDGKLREQMWPEEAQLDGSWMETDPRVMWLMEKLRTDLKHKKVLLIARSGPVVEALENVLRLHAGIRTAMFHEGMSLLERDQAAAYFAEDSYGAQILLCSEIGSEGRNFQFASDLILFDLPANPDVLEQRIGRLDRIGQENRIQIHVPYLVGTAQERMFRWYNEALNIFSNISPTAQTLQENFIVALKDCLLADKGQEFEDLLEEVSVQREALEAELQAGRDRLLEYNSCRPVVAQEIVKALEDYDDNTNLPVFMKRFMASTNIDFDEQSNGTVIIKPTDQMQVQGLTLDEDGMTATFYRDQAQIREDAQYLTLEHPFTESVMEMINTQGFGSTNVAVLKSAALPQGSVLLEVWFKVDVIAPKALNLPSSLPQQLIRVLLSEKGQDLSQKIAPEILKPYLHHLDGNSCRQVVKARRDIIEARYQQALELARANLPNFKQQAKEVYGNKWQYEIDRLTYLKQFNPSIREDEIARLQKLQKEGLSLLDGLSVTPEGIQVMVVVKP
ncbi:RNA polymerase-associated protein RapA [Acinetobacter bohemicus]|uniref:RNA polymerase-associated protein RapA n=1 Tax=Acinetobacter lwoffii TaxID=28090 RepID=A0A9D2UST8_ACILW|nr:MULTISPECIES: RNA polymerase-associated protein RapA [Acinetobacter]MCO8041665.1 RNA polymerase-associated protein RapA [Acinetobacter sp. S4400-12]MDM1780499.1 RNA polymerase-associated protein RapA [Acinetobacter indicus]HJF28044.1 RNA polymerase-associated protein RapA [Acinetobacter lwoffii]MCO8046289.1 RNA polymerase-associated protein RapA [Acinetobacter sp. S4397-1]MCU7223682.1 RNA polymerase-associated protein RapA [Acinetobacter bohemicus]